jgi:hypothetical protein
MLAMNILPSSWNGFGVLGKIELGKKDEKEFGDELCHKLQRTNARRVHIRVTDCLTLLINRSDRLGSGETPSASESLRLADHLP